MPNFQFVGPAYTGRIREIGWEECMNLFPEKTETANGKYTWSLLGTPGTEDIPAWTFPSDEVVRGIYTTSRDAWVIVVAGGTCYRMPDLESSPPIVLATLTPGSTPVSMVDDGRYLSIADGQELWVMDLNSPVVFTTPLSGLVKPSKVAFIAGYTICNNTYNNPAVEFPPTSNLVYFSNSYNASKWTKTFGSFTGNENLNFFSAEGSADPVAAIKRCGDSIWLFGPRSYEVHMLSGNQDKPFSRVGGSLTDVGIYAPQSAATIGETCYFIGVTSHGGMLVYKTNGYNVERISNHAIEYQLDELGDAQSAVGWTYEQEGHRFYVLSIPSAAFTIVYDEEVQGWHNRSSRNAKTNAQQCWEPIYASSRGTRTYVASSLNSRILGISLDKWDEWDGRPIKRVRSSPILWDDLKLVRHNRLQLDMHTGVGRRNGSTWEKDPMVMMRFSDDNGHTWSTEDWSPMGAMGEYMTRVYWNRLGMARSRIYEITITAAVPIEIVGASVITDSSERP